MPIPEITPEKAKLILEAGEGCRYLDVRTAAEFAAGHPVGALNIPIAEVNPRTGQMEMNDRFLQVVQANFPAEAHLIVGCKSGGRSAAATQVLLQAGHGNVCNMIGGYGGVCDASGQVLQEGWSTLGYPVERGQTPDASYEALAAKVSLWRRAESRIV